MSTIDQKHPNGNPANEITDTSGAQSGEETAPASDALAESMVIPPDVIRAGDEALDASAELLDVEPTTDRMQLSTIGLRLNDARLMVSLEDSEGCNLEGRVIVRFMLLTRAEIALVQESGADALHDIAAQVLGRLPRIA